jgi:hypothetical protein
MLMTFGEDGKAATVGYFKLISQQLAEGTKENLLSELWGHILLLLLPPPWNYTRGRL